MASLKKIKFLNFQVGQQNRDKIKCIPIVSVNISIRIQGTPTARENIVIGMMDARRPPLAKYREHFVF